MQESFNITVLLVVAIVVTSLYAWYSPLKQQKLIMNPYRVAKNKEYYRFITSGFIHSNYPHLIFNIFALYLFGEYIESLFLSKFGSIGYLYFGFLFIAGVVISDIPTYLKYRNSPHYNSLGASGGVSAVVFSCILFHPLMGIGFVFLPGVSIPGFIFGILYIIYSYYQSKNSSDNINHDAHLYGAFFGLVFSILIDPTAVPSFFSKISTWSLF